VKISNENEIYPATNSEVTTVFARVICALFFYFGRWKIGVRRTCGYFFCGGLYLGFIL